MVYTRNWISFTEKASFFVFRSKKGLIHAKIKHFSSFCGFLSNFYRFSWFRSRLCTDKKPHFLQNFNIGLIGSCLHPLEKNKSSTLNKKALNKKGFVYLYGSHLCSIFASVIILWISIGPTRNAFRGISHLKPPDSPLTPVC